VTLDSHPAGGPVPDPVAVRRVRVGFWCAAVLLGALHSWANRHTMSNDGVSFLDLSDAWLSGDWRHAVNGVWSPMYAWLIAFERLVLHPSVYWEYGSVQLLNFLVFLASAAAFEFLLKGCRGRLAPRMPEPAWRSVAYVLFLWSALDVIRISTTNGDTLVAVAVYLVAGLLLRIEGEGPTWGRLGALGLVLGLGYLAKAVIFPFGILVLGVTTLILGRRSSRGWRLLPRMAGSAGVMLVVAAPYIAALSRAEGHLTFSETGRLNYAFDVNGVPDRHWRGYPPGSGRARHPTRQLLAYPPVYEFATPIRGTYPLWYDPAYWDEGMVDRLDLPAQLSALVRHGSVIITTALGLRAGFAVGLIVLLVSGGRKTLGWRDLAARWPLLVPGVTGLALYWIVHAEPRYLGAFLVLLYLACYAAAELPAAVGARVATGVAAALVFLLLDPFAADTPRYYGEFPKLVRLEDQPPNKYWAIAEGVHRLGIGPGDPVASERYANLTNVLWARLARVRIIAEDFYKRSGPQPDAARAGDFWAAPAASQRAVLAAFAKAGAKAVIADEMPRGQDTVGWKPIGTTGYYLYDHRPEGRRTRGGQGAREKREAQPDRKVAGRMNHGGTLGPSWFPGTSHVRPTGMVAGSAKPRVRLSLRADAAAARARGVVVLVTAG
jgi:hypothetical protein